MVNPPYDRARMEAALADIPKRKRSTDLQRLVRQDHATFADLTAELADALSSWEDTRVLLDLVAEVLGASEASAVVDAAAIGDTPTFHHGSLTVRGPLELKAPLFVTGDLVVDGFVSDAGHRSTIAVGGDARLGALSTSGEVQVAGELVVEQLVYAQFNDHVLAAGRIRTPLLVTDDHAIVGRTTITHRVDLRHAWEEGIEELRSLLTPDLIVENDDEGEPDVVDRSTLFQRLAAGEAVLQTALALPDPPGSVASEDVGDADDDGSEPVVYVVTSADDGSDLAHGAVSERLAAKASIVPSVEVVYWHDGELVEDEEESLVIFETSAAAVDELVAWLVEEHPFETPSIVQFTPEQLVGAYGRQVARVVSDAG